MNLGPFYIVVACYISAAVLGLVVIPLTDQDRDLSLMALIPLGIAVVIWVRTLRKRS